MVHIMKKNDKRNTVMRIVYDVLISQVVFCEWKNVFVNEENVYLL